MSIQKLAIVTALALGAANTQAATELISSRTGDSRPIPAAIPSGAIVYSTDPSEVLARETRTLSCAQHYGAGPSNITYSGGPRIEYRFETGYEKDASGNLVQNPDGTFVKAYTPWTFESGACFRNHTYNRTSTPCPTNQQGTIYEERKYSITDNDEMINDTGWKETNRTCAWYYLSTSSETRTRGCPSNQRGVITDRRTFDNWSDGSRRNYGSWAQISSTCAYYHVSNGSETRNRACPSGYTGNYVDRRTFQNWSDGSRRNYSGWALYQNHCVVACSPDSADRRRVDQCTDHVYRCNAAGNGWGFWYVLRHC